MRLKPTKQQIEYLRSLGVKPPVEQGELPPPPVPPSPRSARSTGDAARQRGDDAVKPLGTGTGCALALVVLGSVAAAMACFVGIALF